MGLKAISITGHPVQIIGIMKLDFQLPTTTITKDVVIVPQAGDDYDAVIGLDFINEFDTFIVNLKRHFL